MAEKNAKLLRKWRSEGWECVYTKGSHIRLLHPDGAFPVVSSSTPSHRSALANCEAQMKRSLKIGLQRKQA